MCKPNIFNYATSELSQDAFICWLIEWADYKFNNVDNYLNQCAVSFVQALLNKKPDFKIEQIEVGRQWNNIDVWAMVNNKHFIVIEDKKGTKEHSNQLNRYAEKAKEKYKDTNIEIHLIYFKMEEQGSYSNIKEAGFLIFNRDKMLKIINKYIEKSENKEQNDILFDYYRYLVNLDNNINSYQTLPLSMWHRYSWTGFYSELQEKLSAGNWNYVPNASGGFLGFWWNWKSYSLNDNKFDFYLQIEQNHLVFKLYCYNSKKRRKQRDYYRRKLYAKAKELGIPIHQFGRIGQWMGVARLNDDYRIVNADRLIDINKTVKNLELIQRLINETRKEMTE